MKKAIIIVVLIMVSLAAQAQDSTSNKAKKHKKTQHARQGIVVPPWAAAQHYDATAHAYFPDYYTYYDPQRGGYVYWENGKYSFSPALPPFLEKVDLSKSRLKILKGLSLDLYPERDYPYYMKMYPPDPNNNNMVPVPIPGNPAMR